MIDSKLLDVKEAVIKQVIEPPEGTELKGEVTIRIYTEEQQARLKINKYGKNPKKRDTGKKKKKKKKKRFKPSIKKNKNEGGPNLKDNLDAFANGAGNADDAVVSDEEDCGGFGEESDEEDAEGFKTAVQQLVENLKNKDWTKKNGGDQTFFEHHVTDVSRNAISRTVSILKPTYAPQVEVIVEPPKLQPKPAKKEERKEPKSSFAAKVVWGGDPDKQAIRGTKLLVEIFDFLATVGMIGPSITNINQTGAASGLEMCFCYFYRIPAPLVPGAKHVCHKRGPVNLKSQIIPSPLFLLDVCRAPYVLSIWVQYTALVSLKCPEASIKEV